MLQSFRDNLKGVTAGFIVAIIIVPFALFGIDAIFLSGSSVQEVASVDGEGIKQLRLQQAIATRKQQIIDQFGDVDPALLDDEQLQGPVLQSLIRQKAIAQAAKSENMGVSDKTVYDLILGAEVFQTDGKFDPDRFDFVIRQMGYTTKTYNEMLREQILLNQFARGVLSSGFVTDAELETMAAITEQTRDFYYFTIPLEPVLSDIEVTEEEITEYYETNPDLYQEEEKVRVEYIELKAEDLADQVEIEEAAVREAYDDRMAALKEKETREVAHILIEDGSDSGAVIEEIQQKLAAGEDFAELARTFSDDPGSAEQGGNLGVISPGSLPAEFEAAVDQLQEGGISGPVVTEAGTHIIKLLRVNRPQLPAYEQEREKILADLKIRQAAELLPGKVDELSEVTYNADSLAAAAERMGLSAGVSEPFGRNGGEGIARYPLVVRTAFGDDVLKNRYASEVLELGDDHFAVIKLDEYLPAHRIPLDNVRDDVQAAVARTKAGNLIDAKAEKLLGRVRSGEDVESIAKGEGLDWQVSLDTKRFGGNVDGEVRREIFSVPASEALPHAGKLVKNSGDIVVYSLVSIEPGEAAQLSASSKAGLRYSSIQDMGSRELQGYEQSLLADADVKIKDSDE